MTKNQKIIWEDVVINGVKCQRADLREEFEEYRKRHSQPRVVYLDRHCTIFDHGDHWTLLDHEEGGLVKAPKEPVDGEPRPTMTHRARIQGLLEAEMSAPNFR